MTWYQIMVPESGADGGRLLLKLLSYNLLEGALPIGCPRC